MNITFAYSSRLAKIICLYSKFYLSPLLGHALGKRYAGAVLGLDGARGQCQHPQRSLEEAD